MWVIQGILIGLTAGAIMGIISQLGYWIGWIKSHLIVIDGRFALTKMRQKITTPAIYLVGIAIHLITSIVFACVYVLISNLFGFELRNIPILAAYIFALWLAMLFTALPVAGQGLAGNKIRCYVWLEQLVLHAVFGIGLWWASGIF